MSTVKFDKWENSDGTENYKCRAWVNFNGTGTVAIRASGNVSSITDNGVGKYRVNFTSSMPDANYAVACTNGNGTGYWGYGVNLVNLAVESCGLEQGTTLSSTNTNIAYFDPPTMCVSFHR